MRYLIPLEDDLGYASRISRHFGRAAYYAVITIDHEKDRGTIEARIESFTRRNSKLIDIVEELGIDAVIVRGIGMRALQILREKGIEAHRTNSEILDQVLKEIEEGRLTPFDVEKACIDCQRKQR